MALVHLSPSLIAQLNRVAVAGGAPLGADEADVLLAIETILGLAPGAQVTVYDGPFGAPAASFQALFNRMIDDEVDVISNSFFYCEDQATAADAQSLDAILETAAAAGITVLNATGDGGSSCNDGSPDTVALPASAPHGTAVGGTSPTVGPGYTYEGETWFDGSARVPPSGQAGFGTSRFFGRPDYQNGVIAGTKRSIPDVVTAADPQLGPVLCQADAGGCPTNDFYGGTSLSTPVWAGITAILNQRLGRKLGFLNPGVIPARRERRVPLAGEHGDRCRARRPRFAERRSLASCARQRRGRPDRSDGVTRRGVRFASVRARHRQRAGGRHDRRRRDRPAARRRQPLVERPYGHPGHGRRQPRGDHAPERADHGERRRQVLRHRCHPEDVVCTATDTTSGVPLTETVTLHFAGPPATAGSIIALPDTLPANGFNQTFITVTLKDAHGNGAAGKVVALSQGDAHSILQAPTPAVTDQNGQIHFTATDNVSEFVTYTAIDVTDGRLPIPGSAQVHFDNGASGCQTTIVHPTGLDGRLVAPWATGFVSGNFFFGNVNWSGCPGASDPAFGGGVAFVADFRTGDLFKLGPEGGTVSPADVLVNLGPTLGQPRFGKDGRLYVARGATGGNLRPARSSKSIRDRRHRPDRRRELDLSERARGRSAHRRSLLHRRVHGRRLGQPGDLARARSRGRESDGRDVCDAADFAERWPRLRPRRHALRGRRLLSERACARHAHRRHNTLPQPRTPTTVAGVTSAFAVRVGAAGPAGEPRSLLVQHHTELQEADLTTDPPTITTIATGTIGPGVIGPDGCLYSSGQDRVSKLTDTDGGCGFAPTDPVPGLGLTPAAVCPSLPASRQPLAGSRRQRWRELLSALGVASRLFSE